MNYACGYIPLFRYTINRYQHENQGNSPKEIKICPEVFVQLLQEFLSQPSRANDLDSLSETVLFYGVTIRRCMYATHPFMITHQNKVILL